MDAARAPITSPIAFFEAALGICPKRRTSVEQAEEDVLEFLEVAGIEMIPITSKEAETALSAFSRYGKGRGHPAQLNLGGCFAYAMAKNHRRALLFKGDDFDKTDIRAVTRPADRRTYLVNGVSNDSLTDSNTRARIRHSDRTAGGRGFQAG